MPTCLHTEGWCPVHSMWERAGGPPLPYSCDGWGFVYLRKHLKIAFSDFSALQCFHLNILKCERIKSEFRFSFLGKAYSWYPINAPSSQGAAQPPSRTIHLSAASCPHLPSHFGSALTALLSEVVFSLAVFEYAGFSAHPHTPTLPSQLCLSA